MATVKPSKAFLSVRLPGPTRDRLKAMATARGETVQGLVGGLVERFIVEADRQPPSLAAILRILRGHEPALTARGITGLWVFGSVARGDARVDSDVDLLAEFADGSSLSLVGLASLRAELSDWLGVSADLVERRSLRADVLEQAGRDAVRVI